MPRVSSALAGRVGALGEELPQALRDAALFRQAAEVGGERNAPRLGHGEFAQTEKRGARLERDPVRVAAPGVEHHAFAAVLGEFDELVLEFERAEAR